MMEESEAVNREAFLVYLQGSQDALASARYNLDGGFYGVAVNRAYYAFFYAATALLLALDMTRSKHAGVLAAFREHFVKPGLFPIEVAMSMPPLPDLAYNEWAAIREYVAEIRQRFPGRILSVTLFGSKARGEASAESDLDLLVLVDAEDREFVSELWRIASDVSLEHNVVLSVRAIAEARWAESRRMRLPLYRAVQAEGVPLAY